MAEPQVTELDIAGLSLQSAPVRKDKAEYAEMLKDLTPQAKEALKIFEMGVDKEASGSMSDAIEYYRKAVKLDSRVEKLYRAKIYSELPEPELRKDQDSVGRVLDEKAIAKIDVGKLLKSFREEIVHARDELEPSPLKSLPDDIIALIFEILIHVDTPSFVQFALSCRRMAYLGFATSDSWKTLCQLVYKYQNYDDEIATLNGMTQDQEQMVIAYDHNWYRMYSERPFIKFNGIYISVVNYYREGGRSEGSSSWNNPIRMITYYRYIRFFKDGSCMKYLTVEEPKHIVPRFTQDWKSHGLSNIYSGHWTISPDGQVSINSEGSVDRYRFIETLQIKNSAKYRHNRLAWVNYEFMDIETTELNEFDIKKEKPYIFSRVKAYTASE